MEPTEKPLKRGTIEATLTSPPRIVYRIDSKVIESTPVSFLVDGLYEYFFHADHTLKVGDEVTIRITKKAPTK